MVVEEGEIKFQRKMAANFFRYLFFYFFPRTVNICQARVGLSHLHLKSKANLPTAHVL